ncbi:MAG TPA: DUF3224 domain-containing protein [Polyangiaceae bacterium]|nr:DUF3224 domain-containing protein [Polyangiaceae bacterium]
MAKHARGTFEVTLTREPPYHASEGATLGRTTIKKQFQGGLVGTSEAQMLSAGTPVQGSAGYVALDLFSGTLDGRAGTFVLQHSGTMTRGKPELSISVVPDSGTSELTGLAGEMTIEIIDGKHLYAFDYTLDEPV